MTGGVDAPASSPPRPLPVPIAWAPACAYMALIWFMSSLSLPPSVPEAFPFRDKGIHFVEYAVLGLLVGFATRRSWPGAGALRTQLLALVICAGWGVLDELHQAFVPGRASDLRDGVADILGASVGLFVEALGSRLLRRTP